MPGRVPILSHKEETLINAVFSAHGFDKQLEFFRTKQFIRKSGPEHDGFVNFFQKINDAITDYLIRQGLRHVSYQQVLSGPAVR